MKRFSNHRLRVSVLDCMIDAVQFETILDQLQHWSENRDSRYVCFCNVHSVITARQSADFRAAVNEADMAVSDGMPLVWFMRHAGHPRQQRVSGPDVMWELCDRLSRSATSIFLLGGTEGTLERLARNLRNAFPNLHVADVFSPPFRPMSETETEVLLERIRQSGAGVVFVGLGCPKQENWMRSCKSQVPAVMLGVGAAFDYHAGTLRRAPEWMQRHGLEWLHRLCSEPARLWRRYLVFNTIFLLFAIPALIRMRLDRSQTES